MISSNGSAQDVLIRTIRNSLCGYATAVYPDFAPARHHLLIASRLEAIAKGKLKRLIITVPPRHGKSLLASQIFPPWFLGHHPSKKMMSLSYGQDLSDTFGRSVRNFMRSDIHRTIFPESELSADSSSIKRFDTTKGGTYAAIGVGGASTGRGADILLCDDLVKDRAEADSPTNQKTLIDWYKSVARTRLQPNGAIVVVNTRWNHNDFIAWLLKETAHEGWELINLPALALPNDPLGREPGEALWPEAYSREDLLQLKLTQGIRDFQALYQQDPIVDADVIFEPKYLQYYREAPKDLSYYQSWDLTFGGQGDGASWVVGQVWGVNGKNKYLLAMDREQRGFSATVQAIRDMVKRYPDTKKIAIENKALGAGVIEVLDREFRGMIQPVEPINSKSDRAYAVLPNFERGEVFLPDPELYPWSKPLHEELELFPKAATDDCIDSLTQFLAEKKKIDSRDCSWVLR